MSSAPPRDFASAKGFATLAFRAPVRWTESSLIMPVVTSDERLAAETRLRSSATKQRITQPAFLTAVALQRIIDGVYKTWKEAGDDLGLSARQRKELREQVEASRALDYYFAAVRRSSRNEAASSRKTRLRRLRGRLTWTLRWTRLLATQASLRCMCLQPGSSRRTVQAST